MYDVDVGRADGETSVDHCWGDILELTTVNGNIEYPHLIKVKKAAVVLLYG